MLLNERDHMDLKRIKAIITDIDGVLTDGGLYYDNFGNISTKFNVKDGQIIDYLREAGIILGAITGRNSPAVDRRILDLKFDFYRKGVAKKELALHEFISTYNLERSEIAYIGDDLIDLPIFELVGFPVAPADAIEYIREKARFVTPSRGGEGAFRDFADQLLMIKRGSIESLRLRSSL